MKAKPKNKFKNSYFSQIVLQKKQQESVSQIDIIPPSINSVVAHPSAKSWQVLEISQKLNTNITYLEKIFCKCGHNFEVNLKYYIENQIHPLKYLNTITEKNAGVKRKSDKILSKITFNPVICEKCHTVYKDFSNLVKLGNFKENIMFCKFSCVESEENITLYFNTENIGVSKTTKNLFFKKFKTYISYNKNKKIFYILNGMGQFQRIGLKHMHRQIDVFFLNASYGIEKVWNDDADGYTKWINDNVQTFLNKLSVYINENDVKKINEIYDLNNPQPKQAFGHLKDLTLVYVSLLCYPAFSTILFSKGITFYSQLLAKNEFLPSLASIKKTNPSNPSSILEELLKNSIKESVKNDMYPFHIIKNDTEKQKIINKIDSFKVTKYLYKIIEKNEDLYPINNFLICERFEFKMNDIISLIMTYGIEKFKTVANQFYIYRNNELINAIDIKKLHHIFKIVDVDDNISQYPKNFLLRNNANTFSLMAYLDVIRMLNQLGLNEDEILNCKNLIDFKEFHDDLNVRLASIRMGKFNEAIKKVLKNYRNLETTYKDVNFKLLDTAESLEKESQDMHHCVRTYAQTIANGNCIIFKVENCTTKDRATLELKINQLPKIDIQGVKIDQNVTIDSRKYDVVFAPLPSNFLSFNQLKAKNNNRATKKIINTVIDFCKNVANAKITDFHIEHGDLYAEKELKPSGYYGEPNNINNEIDLVEAEAEMDRRIAEIGRLDIVNGEEPFINEEDDLF